MKLTRLVAVSALGLTIGALGQSQSAAAHGDPTCAGVGVIQVHGQHVIGDYVTDLGGIGGGLVWPPAGQVGAAVQANGGAAIPGGPGAGGHFTVEGLAPGASFCNLQAHPNGFNTPDNVPVPGNRN